MSSLPTGPWDSETPATAPVPEQPSLQRPPIELRLVSKRIPIKYCEFKISNTAKVMLKSETQAIACEGIQFTSSSAFEMSTIMRIWIEIPDFWSRKSRLVGYKHTDAPKWFQMLARVVSCEELNKRGSKFQLVCESVNMEPADQAVLNDYLGLGSRA